MFPLENIRPQDRMIEGSMKFIHIITGESGFYPKAYSIGMQRCEGCPVYKIDERTIPTSYYCQCDFVSSYNFSEYVKNKLVPESCKIIQAENIRKHS